MEVRNMHIAGLMNRIVLFRFEIDNSVSKSTHSMREPDIVRLQSYVQALKTYKDHVMAQDPLDLPHWHARSITVKELPSPIETENPSILDVIYLLEAMYTELGRSQSNDLATGLIRFDADRFDAQFTNLVAFIENYVLASTPLDMPEAASSES